MYSRPYSFFVVSGSGQAALTMLIMALLLISGVSRQVSVLAFQLGDAFSNFIVPTSGCLLGALAGKTRLGQVGKIPD
ncbi:MAG: hypothetical protein ACLUOI_32110 [Eisenbergiella sp.]